MRISLQFVRATLALLPGLAAAAGSPVDFEGELRPLLEGKCLACHNPNLLKGELSLHTREAIMRHEGAPLVPGDPDASPLLDAVLPQADDSAPEMPEKGEALDEAEIDLLRRWIADGAPWPEGVVLKETSKAGRDWWAYRPLRETGAGEDIDSFIDAELAKAGLAINPPADRRTLIRRASYDLIGLPPTPEEVEAFVADSDPRAYESLIERLLASPHYGERWGRHWLDVVRFGESNGFERNIVIDNLWPFRDYVIESINADRPFDQMIREHLAGDVLEGGATAIASAFLVAGPYDNVGNQDAAQAAQIQADKMDEMIRASSEAFLGMTVGCARCHDHKFDPITSEDYYALYATFAGVRHGSAAVATVAQKAARAKALQALQKRRETLVAQRDALSPPALVREEHFEAVEAKHLRFTVEATNNGSEPCIDELEIWTDEPEPRNVAPGGKATSSGDYAGDPKHKLVHINDGKYGNSHSWISNQSGKGWVAIELPVATSISRFTWSRDREGKFSDRTPTRYRIETSADGANWTGVRPRIEPAPEDPDLKRQLGEIAERLDEVKREIAALPKYPPAWIGTRHPAPGPFHTFLGGNPQRKGTRVAVGSLSALGEVTAPYQLDAGATESDRRRALAQWVTAADNPLTPRVLANRLWQHHFGTGIVDSPNDFGFMGGRPSHPKLLDFLAEKLIEGGWRLKAMHRLIMTSRAYHQSSRWRAEAGELDGDSRLLWRFPPRRLSAEEIRDTFLLVAGKLDRRMGGAGFRLYEYQQDNVATYVPRDTHGPETYRRAVYHQNARASVVDLMTDFDQPDCAFSAPRRTNTTSPLQALTMLNHAFTIDMATALAAEVEVPGDSPATVHAAFRRLYQRDAAAGELERALAAIEKHGLRALCRALLNSSELIYLD